jgi:hypothetical protein
MRTFFFLFCLSFFSFFVSYSADWIEVSPVTGKIIMLKFDDGYIEKHGYHESGNQDESFLWYLNTERADNPMIYSISSPDDANYNNALNPVNLGRKSKGHDFSKKYERWNEEPWPKAACKNDYASYHYIYLELPHELEEGKTYTLKLNELADNRNEFTFTFEAKHTRATSIHTNNFGYAPQALKKFAYISQWMGTLGPLTDDGLIGKRFDIYSLGDNGNAGSSVFNGLVAKQKNYNEEDNDRSNESPYDNYVVSNVYECDFSSFVTEGEYILVVEGVGSSYPFRIHTDAYHEAFYWTMKGIYLERGLIDAPEQYAGKWAHPAWEDANFVYTQVRTLDLTDESGNNQKKNIFENFDWTVDLSGIRGWYHDAGDWDGYFSHFRVPRTLMWSYELAPDNFKDGELDIPEAQVEYNGYTDTHIPDILDEAVWLVDYFKNNVGPTGGIFGSRVHPDISTESDGLGITKESYPDFVFRDCRIEGIPSWEDCTTWIVHGEDPRDSYAFASIAAQYVFNLKLAESRTAEDYSIIRTDYLDAAITAYNWAVVNTLADDENKPQFKENRAAAAAWLYKVTGEQTYLDQLKSDLSILGISSSSNDLGESKWAVWAYVTIDGSDPLYAGTFDASIQNDLYEAVKKYANKRVTNAIDANRSMRWGGDMMQPVWNGQGTTPWVLPAMVAKVACEKNSDPDAQKYLDACYTTSDYFLGGNQLNMVWLSYIGHEHTRQIMHLDSEYNPEHPGFIPGIPVYGPRPRCDWFAPGPPHPYAGDNCYYNNSHDADFALLDGRIYPGYTDEFARLNWPVHELYFENYGSPPTNEYTIHQTIAPAAGAYGFITAANGNAEPNIEPEVSISTGALTINQGEDITISINANDADGWIYRTYIYANNRLVEMHYGDLTEYSWRASRSGSYTLRVEVEDNLGVYSGSEPLNITVAEASNLPHVAITNISTNGLYRVNEEMKIKASVNGGENVKVEFFVYNDKIGEDDSSPFEISWVPGVTGTTELKAVAVDERGLTSQSLVKVLITSDCLDLFAPEENEEFALGSNVVIKAMPLSCSEEIIKVSFYLSRTLVLEDLTPSPADGSYGVAFNLLPEGNYTAYAIAETVEGAIISDSVHFSMVYPTIGIQDNEYEKMEIYPNPSTGGFTFKYSVKKATDIVIKIFDINGQELRSFHRKNSVPGTLNEFFWDTSNLASGIYSYMIISGESSKNGMLVLKR